MNYNDLIRTVAGSAALTRKQADEAVVTALTVMAEVISAGETQDLLAQLPKSFRERVPVSAETLPMRPIEFVARVADLTGVPLEDAERNARAVFDVLTRAVNGGEMADVAEELGAEYDEWLGRERRPAPATEQARPAPLETPTPGPASSEPEFATVSPIVEPFVTPDATELDGVTRIPRERVHSPVAATAVDLARGAVAVATWPLRLGLRSIGRWIPVLR